MVVTGMCLFTFSAGQLETLLGEGYENEVKTSTVDRILDRFFSTGHRLSHYPSSGSFGPKGYPMKTFLRFAIIGTMCAASLAAVKIRLKSRRRRVWRFAIVKRQNVSL